MRIPHTWPENVAHALMRAVSRLLSTRRWRTESLLGPGVGMSADAARMSACDTTLPPNRCEKRAITMQGNTCAQCGGSLESQNITHRQQWGDELYEFENVPALVCAQCGEVWLEAEVGQLIDKIIQQHPQPKKYHQVPVFSLAEFTL